MLKRQRQTIIANVRLDHFYFSLKRLILPVITLIAVAYINNERFYQYIFK